MSSLQSAGVEFTNGGEPGVKVRNKGDAKAGWVAIDRTPEQIDDEKLIALLDKPMTWVIRDGAQGWGADTLRSALQQVGSVMTLIQSPGYIDVRPEQVRRLMARIG
jgi:hypothetical protein